MKATSTFIAAALALATLAPASASEAKAGDATTTTLIGRIVDSQGPGGGRSTIPFTVKLGRLTSNSEQEALDAVLEIGGTPALVDALAETTVGYLEIGYRASAPIALARRFADASGDHLALVVRRGTSEGGLFGADSNTRYPFSVVVLDLVDGGFGGGRLITSAQIRSRDDGEFDLKYPSYNTWRLALVHQISG